MEKARREKRENEKGESEKTGKGGMQKAGESGDPTLATLALLYVYVYIIQAVIVVFEIELRTVQMNRVRCDIDKQKNYCCTSSTYSIRFRHLIPGMYICTSKLSFRSVSS